MTLVAIFTARKRSLGQGNIFTSVCQEFCSQEGVAWSQGGACSGGWLVPGRGCLLRGVPARSCFKIFFGVHTQGWGGGCLVPGRCCSWGMSSPAEGGACSGGGVPALGGGPPPGGVCSTGVIRPTPRGEVERDQVQAHTWGGNWDGSGPGPHPREKLRGIRSRPTPKGELGGIRSRPKPKGEIEGDQVQGPHPRGKLRGIRSRPPPPDGYCCGR